MKTPDSVHRVEPHEYVYGGFEVMGDCGYCGHVQDDPIHIRARGPQPVPIIGDHFPISRACSRWLGDHDCGKPAVRHVIWDETMENGFVCADHLGEVGTAWTFYAMHEVGPDCAMPGAEFFIEENVCRCADELAAAPEEVAHAVD